MIRLKVVEEAYSEVTRFVMDTAAEYRLDSQETFRLRLTVEEAVANIVDYSGASEMTLDAGLSEGQLIITIADDGQPFNPIEFSASNVGVSDEEPRVGGLGIFYMNQFANSLHYRRIDDRNVLTIHFLIGDMLQEAKEEV